MLETMLAPSPNPLAVCMIGTLGLLTFAVVMDGTIAMDPERYFLGRRRRTTLESPTLLHLYMVSSSLSV